MAAGPRFQVVRGGSGSWTLHCWPLGAVVSGHVPRKIRPAEARAIIARQLRRAFLSPRPTGSVRWCGQGEHQVQGGTLVFEGDLAALARWVGLPEATVAQALQAHRPEVQARIQQARRAEEIARRRDLLEAVTRMLKVAGFEAVRGPDPKDDEAWVGDLRFLARSQGRAFSLVREGDGWVVRLIGANVAPVRCRATQLAEVRVRLLRAPEPEPELATCTRCGRRLPAFVVQDGICLTCRGEGR